MIYYLIEFVHSKRIAMESSLSKKQNGCRLIIYVFGLFLLSFSVVLSILSDLGINAINAVPYVLHLWSGFSLGNLLTAVYCVFILIQVLLLRREFQWFQLFQIAVAFVFGWFTDFWKWVFSGITLSSYGAKFALMVVSTVIRAIAIALYVDTEMIPSPAEGLTGALSKKTVVAFHTMKTIQECALIAIAVILSFLLFGSLKGVREGTVISSVIIGPIIGFVQRFIKPFVRKLCFD